MRAMAPQIEHPLLKNIARLYSNPVLAFWAAQNEAWDRIDDHDKISLFVDRLAAFINPLGMKKVLESRDLSKEEQTGPKTLEQMHISPKLLETLKRSKLRPSHILDAPVQTEEAEPIDEIIPGGEG